MTARMRGVRGLEARRMAGANVESGGRGRRALDAEINMIPMIDLLMVTISFLLITAVWVHLERLQANAQVPGNEVGCEDGGCKPKRTLHLEMRNADRFVMWWTEGATEIRRTEIPRKDVVETIQDKKLVRFPGLAQALAKEWEDMGSHRAPNDRELDRVVLHTDDASSYAHVVAAMDAVHGVSRVVETDHKVGKTAAFALTFSAR
jgi:biopolymer transport protein ExbD